MIDAHFLQRVGVVLLPVLFAIVFHEVAHGYAAYKLGDPTAKMLGRLSLNPVKHIDPVGTILIPLVLLSFGGILFGWAKPVPVTEQNLRNPRRDAMIVAAAGPLSNIIMAVIWGVIFKLVIMNVQVATPRIQLFLAMCSAGISINLILAVLNMLPIPPLDGSRIVSKLLPGRLSYQYDRLEPYGFFIIFGLLAIGVLGKIMMPLIAFLQHGIIHLLRLTG